MSMRFYVGCNGGMREVFSFEFEPTEETHPQYKAVIGPFRTKRGARVMAVYGTHDNPHIQCVADAERIGKMLRSKDGIIPTKDKYFQYGINNH